MINHQLHIWQLAIVQLEIELKHGSARSLISGAASGASCELIRWLNNVVVTASLALVRQTLLINITYRVLCTARAPRATRSHRTPQLSLVSVS